MQTNQILDGAAEAEQSDFSLDEEDTTFKKSLIAQVADTRSNSRNISLEEAKKRVSAVVNLKVTDF